MSKKLFFIIIGLFFSLQLFAKQNPIDSLYNLIKNSSIDTVKVRELNNLAEALNDAGLSDSAYNTALRSISLNNSIKGWVTGPYCLTYSYAAMSNVHFNKGEFFASRECSFRALNIAKKCNYPKRIARLYKDIGDTYGVTGEYEKAIYYYRQCLKMPITLSSKKDEGDCYMNLGNCYQARGQTAMALFYFTGSVKLYEEINYKRGIATSSGQVGEVYDMEGDPAKALDYYFKSLKVDEDLNIKFDVAMRYGNISDVFYSQGDYVKATEYGLKCLDANQKIDNKAGIADCYESLGRIMEKRGDMSSASDYYQKGIKICEEIGYKKKSPDLLVDIGRMYSGKMNNVQALNNYQQALKLYKEMKAPEGEATVNNELGSLYADQKKYKEAEDCLNTAIHISRENNLILLLQAGYKKLSDVYAGSGKYQQAYTNYRSFMELKDSLINRKNIQKLTATELNYEFEKKQSIIKAEQDKKEALLAANNRKKQITLISIIVILILIVAIAFLLFNRQKMKSRTDKIIFEQQQTLLESEKKQAEEELQNAKMILANYTESLIKKSELIEGFVLEIEKLTALKSQEIYTEKIEQLDSLNKRIILTNDDWDKFKGLFEQVYKGFFVKLNDKFPNLTNAEIRLICLMKLNIDTKQMANMLGVSADTITKTKYRLRKKINRDEGTDLEKIIQSV